VANQASLQPLELLKTIKIEEGEETYQILIIRIMSI
jgi:hypothetical protein